MQDWQTEITKELSCRAGKFCWDPWQTFSDIIIPIFNSLWQEFTNGFTYYDALCWVAQFTLYLLVTVKFGQCYAYWVGNDCVAFLTDRIDRFHFIFQLRLNNTSILLNIMTSLHLFVCCWLLTFLRHDHTSNRQNETQTSRYMY